MKVVVCGVPLRRHHKCSVAGGGVSVPGHHFPGSIVSEFLVETYVVAVEFDTRTFQTAVCLYYVTQRSTFSRLLRLTCMRHWTHRSEKSLPQYE